ncbi:Ni/Fe hydrogenase subunit alpha [Thiohalophilus thiocyanatoxydans]|uniref:Coenzyme F420-reducing hydrogenase alpha subunit n=1 Tax=Thiohalophilus thiocyanatoxydans TaxID=381308 RepID=A0A4R8J1Y5_9GAMM|nr:Ni/Fe hydrogenase subunit alpha [Thiohalophilus thiocyanatoxydans]TDY04199.1 coenzyme F420-reducing hydrogenase alpha subunit [Thiohalophilus thiocyanatoxydans]
MDEQRDIRIQVPVLARVEGEGALELLARDGQIEKLQLRIFEPPRLFEKFLEGHSYSEVPDMVARICGICPVAYQMSAVQAIEQVFGTPNSDWIQSMRRAMYCGEWIQSHALHIHLLAAPDFLGFNNAIEMAQVHPEAVQRGLQLQGLGNKLISLFGGRSVHPVGACVGGFHQAPSILAVNRLRDELQAALPEAEELVRWTAGLDLPDDQQEFVSVALRHEQEYPLYGGRLVSDAGLDIAIDEYEQHFREYQESHSTSLYSLLHDKPYLVGPLARLNLNRDRLSKNLQALIDEIGLQLPSRNLFHSIIARAIETCYAIEEAVRLLDNYQIPPQSAEFIEPKAGTGYGCTEAPRGILWHRYDLDEEGLVLKSRIVPPTSQNQARIEEDLHQSLSSYGLQHTDAELRLRAESVIRNYDPCISCATHFLKIRVKRE